MTKVVDMQKIAERKKNYESPIYSSITFDENIILWIEK